MVIRTARDDDWQHVREICCLAGKDGDPIEAHDWEFFSDVWIRPYAKLVPEWCFVVSSGEKVLGYLTGCPRTSSHHLRKRLLVDAPIIWRIARGRYGRSPRVRRHFMRTLALSPSTETFFGLRALREWEARYPAHLHMNLRAETRGQGFGRKLLEHYFDCLRDHGTPGVHLFCGPSAAPFYKKAGFTELGRVEPTPDRTIFALGKSL